MVRSCSRRFRAALLAALFVFSCGKDNPEPVPVPEPTGPFDPSAASLTLPEEFRAAWIATVAKIDWPRSKTAPDQERELKELLEKISSAGCNAVMFQVVSNADALYPSKLLPWSAIPTGTQGLDPGFDPLGVAVETAHRLGMELHAWVNPLRIGSATAVRAENHPYRSHPDWWQEYNGNYFWDPGNPGLRTFLASIVEEIVTNYPVDGVHIDDYFYPSGLQTNSLTWYDSKEYSAYGAGKSLDEWREGNINKMVKAYHETVHRVRPEAVFGVSPAGRLELTRALYADPVQWIAEGSIDYLTPQIYWDHIRNDFADFDTVLDSWLEVRKNVPMMPGLAAYKCLQSTEKNFYNRPEELGYQVSECRSHAGCCGHFWYNTTSLVSQLVYPYVTYHIYKSSHALTPRLQTQPGILDAPVPVLDGNVISWNEVPGAAGYVVLALSKPAHGSQWTASIVRNSGTQRSFTGSPDTNYIILARNGSSRSSYSTPVYIPAP